SRCN
ncbi:L,D-transpeptidase catalytic domain protein, partial [Vibrio harveyi]